MKLADIIQSCKRDKLPCVMVQRFYQPTFSGN